MAKNATSYRFYLDDFLLEAAGTGSFVPGYQSLAVSGTSQVVAGRGWLGGGGGGGEERISFALGRRENQGSLFQSGASLPTARGHESSEGRLQRAIFEK